MTAKDLAGKRIDSRAFLALHAALLACMLSLPATVLHAAEPAREFRFSKRLERPRSSADEIVALTLDSDIYASTRAGYPDLRILDSADQEVPFELQQAVEYGQEIVREPLSPEVVSLHEAGSAIEVQLRFPADARPQGLRFITPQADYERTVRIAGSTTGQDWKLVTESLIFDYSRYMDVKNQEVTIPPNEFRHFKVTISNVVDERESPFKELSRTLRRGAEDERVERTVRERRTFRIDRFESWHDVTREGVRQNKTSAYKIVSSKVEQDSANKRTIVLIETRREPLFSFTLETVSRNFSRRASVEVPIVQGVQTRWVRIGEATLSNLSFRKYQHQQLGIDFPEHRERQYRIVIENEDNPPLDIQGVAASGNVYRAVFLAPQASPERVFYGSESARAPKYETAAVLASLRREDAQPVLAKLGPQLENSGYGPPQFALRRLLDNWLFLGSVIGVMVVVLGWSLYRAGRHASALPSE